MSLWLQIQGLGEPLPARDLIFERVLGEPVCWRFAVHVAPEARGSDQVKTLIHLLEGGPVRAQARVGEAQLDLAGTIVAGAFSSEDERGEGGLAALSRPGTYTGLRRDQLFLEAHCSAPEGSPDAFIPRRRVLRARNLLELATAFDHVAKLSQAVANHLQTIRFSDGNRANVIQDGVSDWQYLHDLLAQYDLLEPDPRRKPLTFIGSVERATAGKWVVNWATPLAYRDFLEVKSRCVSFAGADYDEQTLLSSVVSDRRTLLASGRYPVILHQVRREFSLAEWHTWSRRDVPLFLGQDESFVWKLSDRLFATNNAATPIGWSSTLFTLPKDLPLARRSNNHPSRPWLGPGVVEESTSKGPWIRVRLPGFENGHDVVNVRLTTPSAGTDGMKGLHLVPKEGTEVLLAWSGYFNQSVIALGNVREHATDLQAPSLWLEMMANYHLEEVSVKKIGPITVNSKLDVKVEQPLNVTADGTDVEMRGGIFYTGRGL